MITDISSLIEVLPNLQTINIRYCSLNDISCLSVYGDLDMLDLEETISQSGDILRLSNPDKKLIALALEFIDKGFDVISIGKIKDIFDGEGITEAYKIKSNHFYMMYFIRIFH